jgi:hypothetical protein
MLAALEDRWVAGDFLYLSGFVRNLELALIEKTSSTLTVPATPAKPRRLRGNMARPSSLTSCHAS